MGIEGLRVDAYATAMSRGVWPFEGGAFTVAWY